MTNEEIMSILLYYELFEKSNNKYGQNKKYTVMNTCKWKILFESLCRGVSKLYYTFHYKTKHNNINQELYHTFVNDANCICNESGLHSIAICESIISINDIGNNHNISNSRLRTLQIGNCQDHLTNGRLIAANISHFFFDGTNSNSGICINNSNKSHHSTSTQWIVLPMKFDNLHNNIVRQYKNVNISHIILDIDELSCSIDCTYTSDQKPNLR